MPLTWVDELGRWCCNVTNRDKHDIQGHLMISEG